MADPVFDEDEIKAKLKSAVRFDNLDAIQQGAVQTMIDLYDRGVTRDFYETALERAVILFGMCSKLYMLNSVHDAFHNQQLSEASFDQAYHGLKKMLEKQQELVSGVIDELKECPTSRDRVS